MSLGPDSDVIPPTTEDALANLRISLYSPLDTSKLEIRLLQISCPEPESKDVYCIQETVSLESFLFYRALSYEWGKPDDGLPDGRVFVNGCDIKTTPNLRLALQHLKHGAWYWIDALCINQNDPKERGHQVGLMTKIFEKAYTIDVWLGPHTKDSQLAIDLIQEVDSIEDLISPGDLGSKLSLKSKYGKGIKWLKPKLMDLSYGKQWVALQRLMLRTYWTRLWIIQEIVVTPFAERVQLLCGESHTLFKNLHTLLELVYAMSYSLPAFARSGSWADLVLKIKHSGSRVMTLCDHATGWQAMSMNRGNRYDTDLLRLLADYRAQVCSDQRDKVYALLGVSIQYKDHDLPISYSISVEEVYKNTAKYVMQGSGELDVLLHCRRRDKSNVYNTLPSWVPDWRCYDPFYRVIRDKMKGWKAAGTKSAITSISEDGNVLSVRGYLLGKIEDLHARCSIPTAEINNRDSIETGKAYLRQCLDYFIQASGQDVIKEGELPPETTLAAIYGTVISTTYRRKTCESLWSLENFRTMCNSLYVPLPDSESEKIEWVASNLPDLLRNLASRGLCTIALSGTKSEATESLPSRSTAGLCASTTRLGDDVFAVRGCPHPLVMRQNSQHYTLIDEGYVNGFMNGEAVPVFPEVEVLLI